MVCGDFRQARLTLPDRFFPREYLICGVMLLVAGCASTPHGGPAAEAQASNVYAELYDGKMAATHATELPVVSAEEATQRGDQALRQGDLDLALYQYIQALQMDGNDVNTFNKVGAIHVSRGNLNLAEIAYWSALQIAPDNATSLTELGLILLKKRQYVQARDMLTHSLTVASQQWRAHNALGIIADMQGDHAAADLHYREALQIRPGFPILLNNMGYSRYLAEDWPGALTFIRQALDEDPDYKLAWQNLGLLYAREGKYTAAVDAFSHAMALYKAYNDAGYLAMLDGKYRLSAAYLGKAINLSPSYYKAAHRNLERTRNLNASDERTGNTNGLVDYAIAPDEGR